MATEKRKVTITYRVPEPFVNNMVAGPAARQCENASKVCFYGCGVHPGKVDMTRNYFYTHFFHVA